MFIFTECFRRNTFVFAALKLTEHYLEYKIKVSTIIYDITKLNCVATVMIL